MQFEYRSFEEASNIEQILSHSVNLFYNTGMPDLAQKWERILANYRSTKQTRNH